MRLGGATSHHVTSCAAHGAYTTSASRHITPHHTTLTHSTARTFGGENACAEAFFLALHLFGVPGCEPTQGRRQHFQAGPHHTFCTSEMAPTAAAASARRFELSRPKDVGGAQSTAIFSWSSNCMPRRFLDTLLRRTEEGVRGIGAPRCEGYTAFPGRTTGEGVPGARGQGGWGAWM